MIPRLVLLIASLVLLVPSYAPAQDAVAQVAPVRDPRATAVADATLKALAQQTALADISLQGTVSYTAGSDYQSGTFTFEASGNSKSLIALALDGGQQQEVRYGPVGYKSDSEGQLRPMAVHNCFAIEPWFYPGLSLQALAVDPEVSIVYAGQENRSGIAVHRLRMYRTISGLPPNGTALFQRLSTVDLYVDAATYLPVALTFQTHPDDDLNLDIPVEIQFGDYRVMNGIRVPFRIQRSLQGSLLLDITVSGATANSGLSDSLFAVQVE